VFQTNGSLHVLSPSSAIFLVKLALLGGGFSGGHKWGTLGGHQGTAPLLGSNVAFLSSTAFGPETIYKGQQKQKIKTQMSIAQSWSLVKRHLVSLMKPQKRILLPHKTKYNKLLLYMTGYLIQKCQ